MDGRKAPGRRPGRRPFGTTRGKILVLLCQRRRTVDELAGLLGVTHNAARAQLQRLQRDGFVRPGGSRRGVRRPHVDYELTPSAFRLFPRAYEPVLVKLVDALSRQLNPRSLRQLLTGLARDLVREHVGPVRAGDPRRRLHEIVGKLGGSAAGIELEKEGDTTLLRACSCPVASVTAAHPELCAVVATAISDLLGVEVGERCERGDAPRCCFRVP